MEIYTKTEILQLTAFSVDIRKQDYILIDGLERELGKPWNNSYVNTASGRAVLANDIGEPYLSAILGVWGETPIMTEE